MSISFEYNILQLNIFYSEVIYKLQSKINMYVLASKYLRKAFAKMFKEILNMHYNILTSILFHELYKD